MEGRAIPVGAMTSRNAVKSGDPAQVERWMWVQVALELPSAAFVLAIEYPDIQSVQWARTTRISD
jgi:hypothetical protein